MAGLVLEGGAFRGLFTAGVLDGLMDIGVVMPYIVGVSAGATNPCSYVSGQRGRNLAIMEQYLDHPRYLGARNWLRTGAVMDMDFVFDEIPRTGLPFDFGAFRTYPGRFRIGLFNVRSGQMEFFEHTSLDEHSSALRASCSIPLLFPFVEIGGGLYADGGLGDPISLRQSEKDGNTRHLVVLTQPPLYRKSLSRADRMTAALCRLHYPLLADTLLERWRRYNEQMNLCETFHMQGRALVLRPSVDLQVSRFEKDKDKLRALYQDGLRQVLERGSEITRFVTSG